MKSGITTAVILAAGLGSRLGDLKENRPKAFLKIGGETLIDRSIRLLLSRGITSIIIGTGYKNEEFDALATIYPEVKTAKNEFYANTGSMFTLYSMYELINDSFLLLEGDLLYEADGLDQLLNDNRDSVILASNATHSGDEVYIQCSESGTLERMSKQKKQLSNVCGELVGISKLSYDVFARMYAWATRKYDQKEFQLHYEDALVGVSDEMGLFVKVLIDMAWCEIDDASHLDRAVSIVYPKIKEREKLHEG